MNNGEKSKEQRIANRYFLIESIDFLIKESVYYRAHSSAMQQGSKVASLNILDDEIRAQI